MFFGKLKLLILLLILWLCATVQAETVYHKDHLFNFGMGMRPLALGKAFTAADNDVNAMMFNPAGLASLKKPILMGLKVRRFTDVDQYTMVGAYPLAEDRGVIGLGYLELSLPDILIADLDVDGYTQVAGKAKYGERAYLLSYAKRLDQHALGINVKMYHVSFVSDAPEITDDVQGNTNDIDIGYLYYLNSEWTLGASYRNTIGKMQWSTDTVEKMRAVNTLGAAYAFDWQKNKGTIFFDYETAEDTPALTHLGIEDTISDIFTVRLGFLQRVWDVSTKFSMVGGLGLNYKNFSFDYAYYPDVSEETDNKHFISLGYVFNAEVKPESKDKQVYAPTGDTFSDSIEAIDGPARAPAVQYIEQQYAIMESAN